jgi:hypothetical protein
MLKIAKTVKLSMEDLQAANPDLTLDKLSLPHGSTLKVPYQAQTSGQDMLSTIAKTFEVPVEALELFPDGFKLKIPYHARTKTRLH